MNAAPKRADPAPAAASRRVFVVGKRSGGLMCLRAPLTTPRPSVELSRLRYLRVDARAWSLTYVI